MIYLVKKKFELTSTQIIHRRNNNTADPQAITAIAQFGSLSSVVMDVDDFVDPVTVGVVVGTTGTGMELWK